MLKAAKLPKLAKLWAEPNLSFPFPRSRRAKPIDWPVWTIWNAEVLRSLSAELAGLTKKRIDELPEKLLVDEAAYADECRTELWESLERLRGWIVKASAPEKMPGPGLSKTGNALVLQMDGDQ